MSKHTPGPWVVKGDKVYALDDCEHHPVADCTTNHTCRDEWDVEANAQLIAAAPDLLDMLNKVLPLVAFAYDKGLADAEIIGRDIESAIAKATGEQK